ncbi:phospholipase D family protein [soil metagenome]
MSPLRSCPSAIAVLVALLNVACTATHTSPPPADPPASTLATLRQAASVEMAEQSSDTRLGRMVGPAAAAHPGMSGLTLLDRGDEAFLARLALIEAADESLDLQYYLWYADRSGSVLIDRLLEAASRGVRVRVLIDAIYLRAEDELIDALSLHPNVDLRVFNPLGLRFRDYFTGRWRFNYRMHNKFFIADRKAVVLGGRNMGDDYFGLDPEHNFRDIDVLAFGPAAAEASASFGTFWDSEWTSPVERPAAGTSGGGDLPAAKASFRARSIALRRSPEFPYPTHVPQARIVGLLRQQFLTSAIWARSLVVSDLPGKRGPDSPESQVARAVVDLADSTQSRLLVHSAYFIPPDGMSEKLREFGERGVTVDVLTNSLASNNHVVAHSGYAKHRRMILRAGTNLHELNPYAASKDRYTANPEDDHRLGIHTKAIVSDDARAFIGTFNLDPRSQNLNTECGIIIESEAFVSQLLKFMEPDLLPENSYRLSIGSLNRLVWTGAAPDGTPVVTRSEPHAPPGLRLKSWLLSLLPLDSQL